MLLSKNSPNRYPEDRTYKTGPNFLNKFSSRLPTDDELKQAQNSLSLLKSKMNFNAGGRKGNSRTQQNEMDKFIGDFTGQNDKRESRGNGRGNYRKVFKPNSQLENINKREQRLMDNIDMLDDNLHMQREILGSHSNNNLPPKRGKRERDEGRGGRFNNKIVQDFDTMNEGRTYDAGKYRDKVNTNNGMSSTSTAHTRRKENRRAGKTPPRRHNNTFQNDDIDERRISNNVKNDDPFEGRDPFAKGDTRMIGGGGGNGYDRDPFAKGDTRMMGGGGDGGNGYDRDPFGKGDGGMMNYGNRREEKSSKSRRRDQQKRVKKNKYDDEDYDSGNKREEQRKKPERKGWNNDIYDPYAENEKKEKKQRDFEQEEEENTFGNPHNFNKGKANNRRTQPPSQNKRKTQNSKGGNRMREEKRYDDYSSKKRNKYDDYESNRQNDYNSGNGEERPLDKGGEVVDENDHIAMEAQELAREKTYPCSTCGRKFKKDTLAKHRKVCKKVFASKRPKFDHLAQKFGDDPEVLRKAKEAQMQIEKEKKMKKTKKRGGFPENNKEKWKKQSEAFRAQIKMARGQKVSANEEAVINEVANIGMVSCPHCSRTFGQKAADRHIPICGEKAKRTANKFGGGGGGGDKKRGTAKASTKRRTRY